QQLRRRYRRRGQARRKDRRAVPRRRADARPRARQAGRATRLSSLLTDEDKQALLTLARRTLEAAFGDEPDRPFDEFKALSSAVKEPRACFVSLFARRERLRGCIGSMTADFPLYENV